MTMGRFDALRRALKEARASGDHDLVAELLDHAENVVETLTANMPVDPKPEGWSYYP
jgi:hypothetical protein